MNKKNLLYSLFLLVFLGCGTPESVFDVNARTDYTINLGLNLIDDHFFVKSNIPVPIESTMSSMAIASEDIQAVNPINCFLRPKFGDEINLDFINAVKVNIIDPDNQRPKEMFYLDFVEIGNKNEIQLLPTLIDISKYVQNDLATIELQLDTRQFPPARFDIEVIMSFSGFSSE